MYTNIIPWLLKVLQPGASPLTIQGNKTDKQKDKMSNQMRMIDRFLNFENYRKSECRLSVVLRRNGTKVEVRQLWTDKSHDCISLNFFVYQ